jgi:hypothetical protein
MKIKRPFEVLIKNVDEIRMGSPYNSCTIILPDIYSALPHNGWQDLYAWSEDSSILVLIKWAFEDIHPGFQFCIIDAESGFWHFGEIIQGMANSITVADRKIKYTKFLYDKEKSGPGLLCCTIDGEMDIG